MAGTLELTFADDGFATIRMVNGENRFQIAILEEWNRMLDKVLENESTKALLITGSGKFFSNGLDLRWLSAQKGDIPAQFFIHLQDFVKRLLVFPIPTVALLNGHAFGTGAFLAMSCDYRVMRPDKGWLNWPETALGMRLDDFVLQLARAKIPVGVVQREALLFAKRLTAEHAQRLGLVDAVAEESNMAAAGKKLALTSLGKNGLSRVSLTVMKKDIYGAYVDVSKL